MRRKVKRVTSTGYGLLPLCTAVLLAFWIIATQHDPTVPHREFVSEALRALTSLFRKYKMFEVYPCVSIPNRLRLSSKVVRWKPQDMWITVICRGFRGFIMVGRDAASKKTPGISGISNSEPRAELALEVEVEGKDRCVRLK